VSTPEVSEYLVGSAAFKAVGMGDPHPAGSIPVHLRQHLLGVVEDGLGEIPVRRPRNVTTMVSLWLVSLCGALDRGRLR